MPNLHKHKTRDNLQTLFLSDRGYTWWDRDDAINRAARYLGFTRTGSTTTTFNRSSTV